MHERLHRPGEEPAADRGLDAVFGRGDATTAPDAGRDYPFAIVPPSRPAPAGEEPRRVATTATAVPGTTSPARPAFRQESARRRGAS